MESEPLSKENENPYYGCQAEKERLMKIKYFKVIWKLLLWFKIADNWKKNLTLKNTKLRNTLRKNTFHNEVAYKVDQGKTNIPVLSVLFNNVLKYSL